MKKFLFVSQGYELYGSDRMFIQTIIAIREHYPDVLIKVIIPKEGKIAQYLREYADEVIIDKLSVLRKYDLKRLDFSCLFNLPFNIFKYYRLVKEFDYIYINTVVILDFIILSRFIKHKAYIHIREITEGFVGKFFNKLICFSKANIIFNSSATKSAYQLVKGQNSFLVNNGSIGYTEARQNKFVGEHINILLIARLSYQKGQLFLIEVINKLQKEGYNNLKVRIVGDVFEKNTAIKEIINSKINEYGLNNVFELFPFCNNPAEHYQWADIVVVPSTKPESFGLTAIEGMSAGCLVIAANHGGIKDIVTHNETGLLFEPNNTEDFKYQIIDAIKHKDKSLMLTSKGFDTFNAKFSIETYKKNIIALFQ